MQPFDALPVGYVPPGATLDGATNSSRDYVVRRLALLGDTELVAIGSISRLPLPLQVAFRIKMLTIIALQAALLLACVLLLRFQPQVRGFYDTYAGQPELTISIAGSAAFLLLVVLYFVRNRFPLNWSVLLLFMVAQSVCLAGLDMALDTNLCVFNCGLVLASVVIMIALSGVKRYNKSEYVPIDAPSEPQLLPTFLSTIVAYFVVAIATCLIYMGLDCRESLSTHELGLSLLFQLVLLMWFAYDATNMYRVMSPDEYMQGVVYFYMDLVILVAIIAAVTAMVLLSIAALKDSDNSSSSSSRSDHSDCDCDCDGCLHGCDACCRVCYCTCDIIDSCQRDRAYYCDHRYSQNSYSQPVYSRPAARGPDPGARCADTGDRQQAEEAREKAPEELEEEDETKKKKKKIEEGTEDGVYDCAMDRV